VAVRGKLLSPRHRLSKSRYLAGLQCPKLLWWQVHDPGEVEDMPNALLERGRAIGIAARNTFPGGVLIEPLRFTIAERVRATQETILSGANVIFEASFATDDAFAAVDILERRHRGWTLVEVKAALDMNERYIADAAVQLYVLQRAGIDVQRIEIMYLNRECRHPNLTNLFVRNDVTAEVQTAAQTVPKLMRQFAKVLGGKLPKVKVGDHCSDPYPCPFTDRCWPTQPEDHVSTIYRIYSKTLAKLLEDGYETIHDLPKDYKAGDIAQRQIDSVRRRKMIVQSGLAEALKEIEGPIAFLDFETIAPAIPAWRGCGPYTKVPVQFSCHIQTPAGIQHRQWLADGAEDPRPAFAREVVSACEGARTILAYNAHFEKGRLTELWEAMPTLKPQLSKVHARIQDLLPIVRKHVYHPAFKGSFSIKKVLPALVPDLGYEDLEIQDGATASNALEMFLFGITGPNQQKDELRKQLLAYCERDTLAMVKLFERLAELAETSEAVKPLEICTR
jgi:predicted RecB family nuclease